MERIAILAAAKSALYFSTYTDELLPTIVLELLDGDAEDIKPEEIAMLEREIASDNPSYRRLFFEGLKENPVACTAAQLAIAARLYPGFGSVIGELNRTATGSTQILDEICLTAAGHISALYAGVDDYYKSMAEAYMLLSPYFVLGHKDADPTLCTFKADSRLLQFLVGEQGLDVVLADNTKVFTLDNEAKLYGVEDRILSLKEDIEFACSDGGDANLIICGERESGRLSVASRTCKELGIPLISVEYSFLINTSNAENFIWSLIRECYFSDAALAVHGIEKHNGVMEDFCNRLFIQFRAISRTPFFLITDTSTKLPAFLPVGFISYKMPAITPEFSKALWRGMLYEMGLELSEELMQLAVLMLLQPGQLRRAIPEITFAVRAAEKEGKAVNKRQLSRICYNALDDGRYENVKRVEPGFKLKDLKVSDSVMSTLLDICQQVRLRSQVFDEWGLRDRYAYGRCISVLLSGPPGTGKTMAVHAIAAELGLELYKVDLSQVVDKYIGETEKRLEAVFEKAQRSNMILFFDEADSIMGKRSTGGDAHDKGFNTQIAFILQRIEEYDGIVVLATNFITNIDSAFMRRIRYVLQFNFPTPQERLEIWKGAITDRVPISADVDFDYLAEAFNITGAIIKNIMLNATFYAAGEGKPLSMEHILKAVYRESAKDRSILNNASLGRYEYMLHD